MLSVGQQNAFSQFQGKQLNEANVQRCSCLAKATATLLARVQAKAKVRWTVVGGDGGGGGALDL